jgi:hypothetical protein
MQELKDSYLSFWPTLHILTFCNEKKFWEFYILPLGTLLHTMHSLNASDNNAILGPANHFPSGFLVFT